MPDVTASYGTSLVFIAFFLDIFIYFWGPFMSELLYLHQIFIDCVSNQYWYVKMLDVSASYELPLNFITFLRILHKIEEYPYPPNLCRLSVQSIHLFWYVDMPDVTTSWGRFPGLIGFLKFNVWYVVFHQTFINFILSYVIAYYESMYSIK